MIHSHPQGRRVCQILLPPSIQLQRTSGALNRLLGDSELLAGVHSFGLARRRDWASGTAAPKSQAPPLPRRIGDFRRRGVSLDPAGRLAEAARPHGGPMERHRLRSPGASYMPKSSGSEMTRHPARVWWSNDFRPAHFPNRSGILTKHNRVVSSDFSETCVFLEAYLSDQSPPDLFLPCGWAKNVKSAVLHVISLAHFAIVAARGWAANAALKSATEFSHRTGGVQAKVIAICTRGRKRLDCLYATPRRCGLKASVWAR